MRIITWNCNMAFRKKAHLLTALNPDIVIVPECECIERLKIPQGVPQPTDILWCGDNPNKGLGVFSFSGYRFRLHNWHNPAFKTILPLSVSNGKEEYTVFAIWANNPKERDFQYVGQIWKAINHYRTYLIRERTILAGDFNSNVIWDKKHRHGNHSDVVKFLLNIGIQSTYHLYHNEIGGKEEHPTLFMFRHQTKPYHIDYCFASKDLMERLIEVNVGRYEQWIGVSDHMPIEVRFGDLHV